MIPVNMHLPLKDGSAYYPEPDYLTMLMQTYPAVDIAEEFRKMYAWLKSNPSKMKTRKGIKRFVNSWLSRHKPTNDTSRKIADVPFAEIATDTSWAEGL